MEVHGTKQEISLTVRDSGIGFDWQDAMNGRGLGLISMCERLLLVNGELSVQPSRWVFTRFSEVCAVREVSVIVDSLIR